MKIYEFTVTIKLKEDLHYLESFNKLSDFINYLMLFDEDLRSLHKSTTYKNYCFSSLYPFETDKIYIKDKYYRFTFRSIDQDVMNKFMLCMTHKSQFRQFKITKFEFKEKSQYVISQLVGITPAIITTDEGFWTANHSKEVLKERILYNAKKKYQDYRGEELFCSDEELANVISNIEILNRKPIKIPYKNISFLGNKFKVSFNKSFLASELSAVMYGAGMLEKNSLGMGFCFSNR